VIQITRSFGWALRLLMIPSPCKIHARIALLQKAAAFQAGTLSVTLAGTQQQPS